MHFELFDKTVHIEHLTIDVYLGSVIALTLRLMGESFIQLDFPESKKVFPENLVDLRRGKEILIVDTDPDPGASVVQL